MRTIIHDLKNKDLSKFIFDSEDIIINTNKCDNYCIGCFSCWIKHPKKCIYNDEFSNIVESIKNSNELIIISKSRYGCYSHELKRFLERCIGYVLPYFTIRNGEIHHKTRYSHKLKISIYLYGNIDNQDKTVLSDLIKANMINFDINDFNINYIENIGECENVYIN